MKIKEFFEGVISGNLGKNHVLKFASDIKRDYNGDIQALVDDLFLLAHGALLYGRTQAVSDSEEIDRLEKAASVICEEYGLDWMEAGTPTLQELLNRKEWICQKLECLEALELGSDAIGKLVASKPELAELMDRIQAASKGVSDTTGEPRDTKAAMRLYQEHLAEITAEIEQARQQEAERVAAEAQNEAPAKEAEAETDQETQEQEADYRPKKRNQRFKTWIKKCETFKCINDYLVCQNYIDTSTTVDQWLWVCGLSKDPQPKIKWITSVELFVYFINKLLEYKDKAKKDTQKNHWVKALNTFELPKSEKGKQYTNLDLAQTKNKVDAHIIHGADKDTCDLLDKAIAEALKLEE